MINKNIFIVNCGIDKFENLFSRKRNSDIINYYEIRQRLTNNDIFKTPPSMEIIEFQIIKKINAFSKCKKTEFLFFYSDNVDFDFITKLKTLFSGCEFPINYHLISETAETKYTNKLIKEFNSVQSLDNF